MQGIKGETWLSCLTRLDLVRGISPEYMHSGLLVVSKHFLTLWTSTSRCSGTAHDLHSLIGVIDEWIKTIKVTHDLQRKPRGINELVHWKGNLLWHNNYNLFIILNYNSIWTQSVDTLLFNSSAARFTGWWVSAIFNFFSRALWYLLQQRISSSELQLAETWLKEFNNFVTLYGG